MGRIEEYTFNTELFKKLVHQSDGLTKDLAEKIGISQASLIHYMEGKANPCLTQLIKISTYFQVPIDILIGLHTEKEVSEFLKGNADYMMRCKKRAYKDYLLKRRVIKYPDGTMSPSNYISYYPYNLLDAIFQEPWLVPLDEDHENALQLVLDRLIPRERAFIYLYFKDEKTLEQCGKEFGVTRERARQIVAKALRKLRHPARSTLIKNGINGSEIHNLIEQEKEIAERKRAIERSLAEIKEIEREIQEKVEERNIRDAVVTPQSIYYDVIEELNLSLRSYNCLCRANCRTVDQVITLMEDETIFRVRNLGRKSIAEIQEKIGSKYHMQFVPKVNETGRVIGYTCIDVL